MPAATHGHDELAQMMIARQVTQGRLDRERQDRERQAAETARPKMVAPTDGVITSNFKPR